MCFLHRPHEKRTKGNSSVLHVILIAYLLASMLVNPLTGRIL